MKKPGNINEHKSTQNENNVINISSHDLFVFFNIINYGKKKSARTNREEYRTQYPRESIETKY